MFSALAVFSSCGYSYAQDGICVRVKVEIDQEVTMERQGFEARMNIGNGGAVALENVAVEVNFSDADGEPVVATSNSNDTTAKFFIRLTSGAAIPDRVVGGGEERLRWLIVPALAAGGASPAGELYFVGAKLSYTTSGVESVVDVSPDSIRVAPMPSLVLDYFLPYDVYGDDPFTAEIEAPVPFSLGVRVKNSGFGPARRMKIESGQPRIVENNQGLLISYRILGSEVNGAAVTPSLLADFGDIGPDRSGVARWIMTTSLYGRFVDFSATFTHADELGGQLTSLITAVDAHRLVRDVLVDVPGRDGIRDFLATDGELLTVYESEGMDTAVADLSLQASIAAGAQGHVLSVPGSDGFSYVKLVDPYSGTKVLALTRRGDGKPINAHNAWLSSTFVPETRVWEYFVNLFDANNVNGAPYEMAFTDPGGGNRPPVLRQPADRLAAVGTFIGFIVEASDPEGSPVTLTADPLPPGATFADNGQGTGTFSWTPGSGQAGNYPVQFTVSDGTLTDRKTAVITVTGGSLLEAWKSRYWPGVTDPAIIGDAADADGDELPNGIEYVTGSDPTDPDSAHAPVVRVEKFEGLHYLTMAYLRRTDDPALICTVMAANSLKTPKAAWVPADISLPAPQDGVPDGFLLVKTRDSVAVEGGSQKRFLELRVGRNQ